LVIVAYTPPDLRQDRPGRVAGGRRVRSGRVVNVRKSRLNPTGGVCWP